MSEEPPNTCKAEDARKLTVQEKSDRVLAIAAEIRAHFKHPLPTSDHSFLYDEQGLSHPGGRFELTDIEPALKD